MKKQLEIRIYPDGKIESKTLGILGKKCTDYIAVLEDMTDARTTESSYTDDYYRTEEETVINTEIKNINGLDG